MNNFKLSFIIPVYNGEKYINKCLNKLLSATFDKEIIVVDDGSTDQTLKLLKEYGDKIILITFDHNQGVSNARNIGLNYCNGNFVAFIDIDDDFEIDMYSNVIETMIFHNSDISIFEFDVIDGKHIYKSKYKYNDGIISKNDVVKMYLCDKIYPSSCFCIIEHKLAKLISFPTDLKVGEDIFFILRCLINSNKPILINKVLYHYIQNENSTLHTLNENLLNNLKVVALLPKCEYEYLRNNFDSELSFFELQMYYRIINSVSLTTNHKNRKNSYLLIKKIYDRKILKQILKNKYSPKYIKYESFILYMFGIKIHLFLFPLYNFLRKAKRRNDD